MIAQNRPNGHEEPCKGESDKITKTAKSPLDVPAITAKIATKEVVDITREGRESERDSIRRRYSIA